MWKHKTRPLNSSLTAQALILFICISTQNAFAQALPPVTHGSDLSKHRITSQDANSLSLYVKEQILDQDIASRTLNILPLPKELCDKLAQPPFEHKVGNATWQWCELLPTKKYVDDVITTGLGAFAVSDERLAASVQFQSLKEEVALLKRRIDFLENERKLSIKSNKPTTPRVRAAKPKSEKGPPPAR